MNIRKTLAQIANEMDDMGLHGEADAIDGVLRNLSDTTIVTPESVLIRPDIGEIMKAARGWVEDCQWNDQEDIASYNDFQILRGIERHYDGGLDQFLRDIVPH